MSPSWADTCTGYDVLTVGPSETTDLGQGMKLTSWKAQSVLLSNDSKYNVLVGDCLGTILQNPDGKTQAAGNCARRDKDGNTESDAWSKRPAPIKASGTPLEEPASTPASRIRVGTNRCTPTRRLL